MDYAFGNWHLKNSFNIDCALDNEFASDHCGLSICLRRVCVGVQSLPEVCSTPLDTITTFRLGRAVVANPHITKNALDILG